MANTNLSQTEIRAMEMNMEAAAEIGPTDDHES